MARSFRWSFALGALALVAAFAIPVAIGVWMRPPGESWRPETLALPSVGVAKVTSLGFDNVIADAYLLRAIQYFGESANAEANYEYLFPLLDLVSELDPKWPEPLLWGGIAVQRNLGRETWINTAESTRLLQKGAERFPNEWRFHVFLAYNLSTFHNDNEAAARALEKAIDIPGRPSYVPSLVTRFYASAGDLDSARTLAAAVAEESADPDLQQMMKGRLVDLDTEKLLRELDEAIARFHELKGEKPNRIEDLVSAGVLSAIPEEPRGGSWYIAQNGEAMSTNMESRLRVHAVPRKKLKAAGAAEEPKQ